MGYCPQNDAMFDYLTVEQTLKLFARLKGVESKQSDLAVNTLMKTLLIEQYKDKLYKNLRYNVSVTNVLQFFYAFQILVFGKEFMQYVIVTLFVSFSGGTKRKLNTAAAMMGDPQILLLDEPTTGLDPVSRRRVWTLISKIRETGRTIILTSHR